jgi:hypothetical protein
MWDAFQQWAVGEVREVRRAPFAIVVLVVFGFAAGWYVHAFFTSQQIQILELQRDTARAGIALPARAASPPATLLFPYLSVRVAVFLAFVVIGVFALAWRNGRTIARLRRDGNAQNALLLAKDDLLHAAADLHGKLSHERDVAVIALKDKRYEYAMDTLRRYSMLRVNGEIPSVTIRCTSYGRDFELAEKVRGLFTQHVNWPVTLDVSNTPALPRAEQFKVVFDTGMTVLSYGDLIHAFAEGDLVGVTVGHRRFTDREDAHHLIVLVLPSADAA